MNQVSGYKAQGAALFAVCIVMMYLLATLIQVQPIGWPRYHKNLDQPSFLAKSIPEMLHVLYYNQPEWVIGKEFDGCQYPCKMISGSVNFSSARFVIFHGPRLNSRKPPKKSPGQIWIMHGMESPNHYHSDLSQWTHLFNWTFTYRRDSDVLSLYSGFEHTSLNTTTSAVWKTKDRLSAWMASNCRTPGKREQYIQLLRKSTDVHVYGGCGTYRCARSKENSCMGILRKHYRYYLAFENTLCVDYITEKGFKTYSFSPSTIPVMRGGSNYSLFFPPGSYIDTKDFESAFTLGKTLNMTANVMKNTKIERFFSWTKSYSITPNIMSHLTWCTLCERIHHSESHKRLYSNIKNWLNDNLRSGCESPSDLK
ncbi:alpha-(1,3)-fucosyltransferase C-like isoform X2 [Pecten maximus]|uniref:alpha-(1,3)-fucosyltransferase C-like isoform X2 n=1 Tax=Pecten maximus TaxID=6579 RepID=UPI001458B840|nr:alpha-(1,3)-fucosyltransferase C-like isoform X2 [Pecten maximus]